MDNLRDNSKLIKKVKKLERENKLLNLFLIK